MAEVIQIDRRQRCRWCEGRVPRIAINAQGYAIVTTNIPGQWRQLARDRWRKVWVTQLKDHREITFLSPTPAWKDGSVLTEYLIHPICAAVRHRDLMNGF